MAEISGVEGTHSEYVILSAVVSEDHFSYSPLGTVSLDRPLQVPLLRKGSARPAQVCLIAHTRFVNAAALNVQGPSLPCSSQQ